MATILSEQFTDDAVQIASSATEYVQTAANEKVIIDKFLVHNTNTSSETIKGYTDATGDTPAAANQVFEIAVPAGETKDVGFAVNLRLGNSKGLFVSTTTASKVNLHISGRRLVG